MSKRHEAWLEEVAIGWCAFCALVGSGPKQNAKVESIPDRAWLHITADAPIWGRYGPVLSIDVPDDIELPNLWVSVPTDEEDEDGNPVWVDHYPADGQEFARLCEGRPGYWLVGG
jgi:hypothetical protein